LARQYALLDRADELGREYERTRSLKGINFQADEAMHAYLMHHGAPRTEIADRLERDCTAFADAFHPSAPPPCFAGAKAIRSPERATSVSVLREQLDSLRERAPTAAASVAFYAAYLGERELALDALAVLAASSSGASLQNLWYPLLGDARKDPRFKEMVRNIGWVELWRKTGRWGDFCRPIGEDDFECF